MKTNLLLFPSHFDTQSGILPCKPYLLFIVENSYYLSHPSRLFLPMITWSTSSLGAQDVFFHQGFLFILVSLKHGLSISICAQPTTKLPDLGCDGSSKSSLISLLWFIFHFLSFLVLSKTCLIALSTKLISFISHSYIPSHTATQ